MFYININIVANFCEKNNIHLDINKNGNQNNNSSPFLRKTERSHSNINSNATKYEMNGKYNKAFEILNNMNNKKYTMKYIGENKLKNKNLDNNEQLNLNNCNKNYSPINNIFNKINNKNSSNFKVNTCLRKDKNKNKSTKKCYNNTSTNKINIIDKEKENCDNNNIHEYKINNLSSSYNNNFTNIKTDKIVFIDMKNNNNSILNNDENIVNNQNEKKLNLNELGNNNKLIIKSSRNKMSNKNNIINEKSNNINNTYHQSTFNNNMKNLNTKNILETNNIINLEQNKITHKNNKFYNLSIQKSEISYINSNSTNNIDKSNNKIKAKNENMDIKNKREILKNNNNLSIKERAYYILSKSSILRFCERMIFSRSTSNLRKIITKEAIINDNKIVLENKIIELKQKIDLCNKILDTPFTASKTSDITLNFITSLQEIEFKDFPILSSSEEEKKYYITYIKILYCLLNEEIERNEEPDIFDKDDIIFLRRNLYLKLNNKGFKSIRDYLYKIYIKKKDIKEIPKIAEMNYLVSQVNDILIIQNPVKICKFISFTIYLIKEIINFGNKIKSTIELKIKAKNLIEIIIKKLNKYNNNKIK